MNIIDYTGTSLILSIRKYKGIISFKYVKKSDRYSCLNHRLKTLVG